MYSVIICSRDDARFSSVSANLAERLGDREHEIIRLSDARSMAEGYNRGIEHARGDRLIFCHDDIEILNSDAIERLDEHLQRFDLVGVAGTDRVMMGFWSAAGPVHMFGQVAHVEKDGFAIALFGRPSRIVLGIEALDGIFFAIQRKVVEKIKFDAGTFDGFHLYDLDFTFAAHLVGFQLAVANDIHLLHLSIGSWNEQWAKDAHLFGVKYAGRLYPQPLRPFQTALVRAATKRECAEIMREATPK
jgi:glycosyltransferase involved in cell wall biosynthesis